LQGLTRDPRTKHVQYGGQAYDNASTMSGIYSGVHRITKEINNPNQYLSLVGITCSILLAFMLWDLPNSLITFSQLWKGHSLLLFFSLYSQM